MLGKVSHLLHVVVYGFLPLLCVAEIDLAGVEALGFVYNNFLSAVSEEGAEIGVTVAGTVHGVC